MYNRMSSICGYISEHVGEQVSLDSEGERVKLGMWPNRKCREADLFGEWT